MHESEVYLLFYSQADAHADKREAVHKVGRPINRIAHPCGL